MIHGATSKGFSTKIYTEYKGMSGNLWTHNIFQKGTIQANTTSQTICFRDAAILSFNVKYLKQF